MDIATLRTTLETDPLNLDAIEKLLAEAGASGLEFL